MREKSYHFAPVSRKRALMKILVADDDIISRRSLQLLLGGWGHEVTLACDGAEAWQCYQREHFPLVISDWMMPNVDGLELVRRIRRHEGYSYTFAILLTAKSGKDELVEGMEAGADDFIVKPFDAPELHSRLRAGERILRLERSLELRNQQLEAANAEIAEANRRMKYDLQAAAKIQRNLLPKVFPETPAASFAWFYKPCEELAGDILNVIRLDEHNVGLYILDVSGHGVPSSLLAVTLHQALSPVMEQSTLLKRPMDEPPGYALVSPAEVAAHLNRLYPLQEEAGLYFTLLYGVLNLDTCQFRYVQAGHPSPVRLGRGATAPLDGASNLPIGFFDDAVYEENVALLEPGDRLCLYSDGVYEVANEAGELFGQARLAEALARGRGKTLADSLSSVVGEIETWGGSNGWRDDVSLLAVDIHKREH